MRFGIETRTIPRPLFGLVVCTVLCTALLPATGRGATADGFFAENWDGGVPSSVTLAGNAFWTASGGTKVVLTNGPSQFGRAVLQDLNPGQNVDAITACSTLFIGQGNGGDGFAWSFGDPSSIGVDEDGVSVGLAVSLDTYDNGGGDVSNAIEVLYDGNQVAQSGALNLRTNSFVSLCVTVLPNGEFWVKHNNDTLSGTIGTWSAAQGRQVVWSARTGGSWDEHTIEDVTVVTFPSGSFFERYRTPPANTSFYGNARQDDFYARLTDNSGSQKGSAIVVDQNPGGAIGSFNAQFAKYIWDGGGADGISFNFGNLPDAPFGEGGAGSGLIVSWPTYNNDRLRVYYNNQQIAESGPRQLRGQWTMASVAVDSAGVLQVTDNTNDSQAIALITTIPGWAPQSGWRFGWGGRTGGITDNHAITNALLSTGVCGNGTTETGEQCDEGAANGTAGSCCSSSCTYVSAGTNCRASTGACDPAEACTGTSPTCPADAFAPTTQECRAANGTCDVAEYCTGSSASCPTDGYAPSTQECRAANGECDAADYCTGSGPDCPADAFQPDTTPCTGSSNGGACDDDAADHCSGTSSNCVDEYQPTTFECNAAAGQCDVAEFCSGTSGSCPTDAFQPDTTPCSGSSNGGVCDDDAADHCSGTSDTCVDEYRPTTYECNADAGQCDVPEYCTGTSGSCPADAFEPVTTPCTGTSQGGACNDDAADHCSGTSNVCVDVFEPPTTECRPGSGNPNGGSVCDPTEYCTGTSGTCPPENVVSAGTVCNPGSGDFCDPDEVCSGVPLAPCPEDHVEPAGRQCRASIGECDDDEVCSGVPDAPCPSNTFFADGLACYTDPWIEDPPNRTAPSVLPQPCNYGDCVCNSGRCVGPFQFVLNKALLKVSRAGKDNGRAVIQGVLQDDVTSDVVPGGDLRAQLLAGNAGAVVGDASGAFRSAVSFPSCSEGSRADILCLVSGDAEGRAKFSPVAGAPSAYMVDLKLKGIPTSATGSGGMTTPLGARILSPTSFYRVERLGEIVDGCKANSDASKIRCRAPRR
jgi:hypothetical protein